MNPTKALQCLLAASTVMLAGQGATAGPAGDDGGLRTVTAQYTLQAPPSMTEQEARELALTRAKIQALEREYGSVVAQNNTTLTRNSVRDSGSASSDIDFVSVGRSEVRGEWIETLGQPVYDVSYNGGLVVTVTVKGIVREITGAATDFRIKVYCNGVGAKFERTDFISGDDIFLSFTSPVDGWLAVYLLDPGGTAYSLLPYPDDNGQASPVKAAQERILFSYDHPSPGESVKQYHMTTDTDMESDLLYVVFSPNGFSKATDSRTDTSLPAVLQFKDFHKWLASCRRRDRSLCVREIPITIRNKSL